MKDEITLILALQQINNLTELLKNNQYKNFLFSHLISVKCELDRQLTNLSLTASIKE